MKLLDRPLRASRAGITLTEILIAIMILGIGFVSLATLFPIGMLRLREAQRMTRTAYLGQSAAADIELRGLLNKNLFIDPYISPWYASNSVAGVPGLYPYASYDPWIQDTPAAYADWTGGNVNGFANAGAFRGFGGLGALYANQVSIGNVTAPNAGPGLPVAFDPLWRAQTGLYLDRTQTATQSFEGRFASGIGSVRPDTSAGGTRASAHGLQRLTNFLPTNYSANAVNQAFISPEDVVWQDPTVLSYLDYQDPSNPVTLSNPSPIVPDLALGNGTTVTNDLRFTWMFTGQQTNAASTSSFDGNVVIFENRPFAVDQGNGGFGSTLQVAGERVVQAIFGYAGANSLIQVGNMNDGASTLVGVAPPIFGLAGAAVPGMNNNANNAFNNVNNNSVLLFWPAGTPDLEIKSGSWIADVTYERNESLARARFQYTPLFVGAPPSPPAQRCFWYQVVRATHAADTAGTAYAAVAPNSRYIMVYAATPLRAKTLWDVNNAVPYHVNAALVSPYVVNVIPKSIVIN